jgi:myo-inositol 2-dehydrogenase / D-chiro-inositol 1-dehydrogenase
MMSDPSRQAGTKPTTRQDFLKSSTLAGAAALAAGLGIARSAHAAGGDQIKVSLIGCGGRGSGAAANCLNVKDNLKLVAMADAFEDRLTKSLEGLQRKYQDKVDVPKERQFVGFDAYQKAIDCGVDLVLLATPPGFRPIHYAAAVKAGKHVFIEKPVAVDGPGIRQVLATAEEAKQKGLSTVCGLQRRHQASYLEGVKRIQDGAIGEIVLLRAYWNGSGIWFRPRKEGMTEMEYQMRNWYHFCWLCGDHICEQHVHNLDVCNWVKNDHPVKANGMGGRMASKDYRGEIYNYHIIEFEYADGSRMLSQCRQIPNCWNTVSEYVHGTKGSASPSVRTRGRSANPYDQEHVDLVASIRDGKPLAEGVYGATSTMTAILGRAATYSGKLVTWDEVLNAPTSLAPDKYDWNGTPKSQPDKDGFYAMPTPGVTQAF